MRKLAHIVGALVYEIFERGSRFENVGIFRQAVFGEDYRVTGFGVGYDVAKYACASEKRERGKAAFTTYDVVVTALRVIVDADRVEQTETAYAFGNADDLVFG